MAWTAKVTRKEMVNGAAVVTLEFTDGQRTVTETYKAFEPAADWIPRTAKHRIEQLSTAYEFDIPIGDVTIPPDDPPVDPNIALFQNRCRVLEIVKIMIDLGVVQQSNPKVQALINWLKNNFETYFDKL